MKYDESRHDAVWASAPCGVCLTFMGSHTCSRNHLMVTDTFRVAHGLMTTGTRMQKPSAIPHHNSGYQSVCPPGLCICPACEIIFVISSRGRCSSMKYDE